VLDTKIFFKTFAAVFSQEGVYIEGDDTDEAAQAEHASEAARAKPVSHRPEPPANEYAQKEQQ
jgi:hypothetical protein